MRTRPITLAIARTNYGDVEHSAIGSWLASTCCTASDDKARIADIHEFSINRSPAYAAYNAATLEAIRRGADVLVRVDNDMVPDIVPDAQRFFDLAFDFWWKHDGPCVLGAPARTVKGDVCVYQEGDQVDAQGRKSLVFVPAAEAVKRTGVERVPATGLSLALFDMAVFRQIPMPWFQHRYAGPEMTEIACDDNPLFNIKLAKAGVPCYCVWSSWQGHAKTVVIGPPRG